MARHRLKQYQKDTVYEIEQTFDGRSLVSLDMGLGKTLIVLWYLHRNPQALPAVVVCPASVKYVWEKEATEQLKVRPIVLEGTRPSKAGQFSSAPKITVINYDILGPWLDYLKAGNPQTIVLDETHLIGNRQTARTKNCRLLCRGVPNVLALSGTPLTNRPAELWPTLNILRPEEFKSFWSFAHAWCDARKGFWGWTFTGAKNTKALHQLLKLSCMVRYRKKDVLAELPDKVRNVTPVPMADPAEYKRAETDFLVWLNKKDPGRAKAAARAQKLVQMGYLKRLAAQLKVAAVAEWINNFLETTDEKLVVFAVHKGMIRELQTRCKTKSVTIDGSVTGRLRQAAAAQFQNDKATRLFFGNLQAAGVGLTLTAASTVVFAEMGWTPGSHTQAEDRIHRIGQMGTAFVYYLVAAGTIEAHLCEIIQEKQEIIKNVLDGGDAGESLEIYDQLLARLQGGLIHAA